MGGLVGISELAVALALVTVVVSLTAIFLRRRLIAAGAPMFLLAYRCGDGASWRYGVARFDTAALLVYPLAGFSLRPSLVVDRSGMELMGSVPAAGAVPGLLEDPLVLSLRLPDGPCQLAMGRDHVTAVRSWHEARPPRRLPRQA